MMSIVMLIVRASDVRRGIDLFAAFTWRWFVALRASVTACCVSPGTGAEPDQEFPHRRCPVLEDLEDFVSRAVRFSPTDPYRNNLVEPRVFG